MRDAPDVKMLFPWLPEWVDLNIAVPIAATIVVVVVGIVTICVALSRRTVLTSQTRLRNDCMSFLAAHKTFFLFGRLIFSLLFADDVVYNQSVNATSTLDKRRPDLRDELGYIAPPNRKLPPVPGSNYNTCDRIKRGTVLSKKLHVVIT